MVLAAQLADELLDLVAPASGSDDEAFCRRALRDGVPALGLSLGELLRQVRPERAAA